MTPHSAKPSPQSAEAFDPKKFSKGSTLRDYVIYALMLVALLSLVGGGVYYFTRSETEKEKLRGKVEHTFGLGDKEPVIAGSLPARKNAAMDELMGTSRETTQATSPVTKSPEVKPVAVSAYSGGGDNRVVLSTDPRLPQASPEFIQFAKGLKVNGVFAGNPAKMMLDRRWVSAGETIDPQLGVVFVGLDDSKKLIHFRDKTGAELRLGY